MRTRHPEKDRRHAQPAISPGSLLRLLTGRRMLLPIERAKLAAAVALIEDLLHPGRRSGHSERS